jgi:hypothetical protein
MIVKIQRPFSPQGADQWLIIDRSGGLQRRVSEKALPAGVRAAMDGDAKGYFRAALDGIRLSIYERVSEQPW